MTLTNNEILLRVGLTCAASIIIGFERESHGRAAGLRTTVLVGVAAAIAMILSEQLYIGVADSGSTWRPDPARLAAGILAGMGFLGAGAIIREGNTVRGVTTAAVLWVITVIGLSFGSGQLMLGMIGWAIAFVTLFVLPKIESRIPNDWYGTITVRARMDGVSCDELRQRLETLHIKVKKVHLDHDLEHGSRTLRFDLKFKKHDQIELPRKVLADLEKAPGVLEIRWE
ncbi:MAG: MgtC/SapB family protein [Planctomycetes bacterium]|nr:MgtC/SapB family protein [Planctomycetota bacterium]